MLQMNLKKIVTVFIILFFVATNAQEKILKFDTKIQIEKSGIIQVIENITIKAEGNIFQRGLVRTLPLTRKDKDGNSIDVEYQINSVKKNGNAENYFTKTEDENWKIYIGNEDVFLEPGIYEYQITYSSPFQIGHFDAYDEIYWNVNGNDGQVPIDKINCQVFLPGESKFSNVFCYTGLKGSKNSDCISSLNDYKTIASFSGANFAPNEGLTIATSFDKGIVNPPTKTDEAQSYYKLIKTNLWSAIYGVGMLIFFYLSWRKHGKDPLKMTIIPEFRPPFDWSPAILSYVYNREITEKSFMASLINIAVKGAIKISSTLKSGVFTNKTSYEIEIRNRTLNTLSIEEKVTFDPLSKTDKTIMNSSNHHIFGKSYDNWLSKLESQIKLEDFYQNNTQKKWVGFAVFVLTGLLFILLSSSSNTKNFPFLFGLVIANTLLISWFVYSNKYLIIKGILAFFLFPMTLFLFFGIIMFLKWQQILILVTIFIVYIIYRRTIGKFTQKGAEAIARAEGFKLYLETAEQDRMNMLNPPELTPTLFEELFPYAIALGVELNWGKQFEKVLETAKYNPEWCQGDDEFYRRPTNFISSFNDSVLDSRIDPTPSYSSSSSDGGNSGSSGSWSSGSSGSGSSGGGGGGGGTGGW